MSTNRPLSPEEARQVMERAWQLQAERDDAARTRKDLAEKARAGQELGLDPELLREAEALVRVQAEGRALHDRRRLRVRGAIVGLVLGILLVGGTVPLLWSITNAPPAPIEASLGSGAWKLETSPGSVATLQQQGEVSSITVERFTPGADGRFWVNLESAAPEGLGGHETVSFEAQGEGLRNVRLYLETPNERWRGPSVPLSADWSTHMLRLSDFEHQVKDGGWSVTSDAPPRGVETLSFKLGWYVNEPDSVGSVSLRGLRVE